MISSACQQTRTIPVPDCGGQPFGAAGVEFAPANILASVSQPPRGDRLVVRVREGTAGRPPIGDASVALFVAGVGPDSGHFATARITAASGIVTLDSLAPGRYELLVRRIGYDPFRQRATVRTGFIDTLIISLRGVPVCLSG